MSFDSPTMIIFKGEEDDGGGGAAGIGCREMLP